MRTVVVNASGCHLGYIGCYGNEWIQTPNLDQIAAEGVVFDQHYADNPDSVASRLSLITGRYHFHAKNNNPLEDSAATLARWLRDAGIATCRILASAEEKPPNEYWGHHVQLKGEPGQDLIEALLDSLGEALDLLTSNENWLLWLDIPFLITPLSIPEKFAGLYFMEEDSVEALDEEVPSATKNLHSSPDVSRRIGDTADEEESARQRGQFAGAVTYLDTAVGQLVEEFQNRRLWDDLLFLFTSDRGQNLGENGREVQENPTLHEEWVHVPLIIRFPRWKAAGKRIFGFTQPVDVAPTLVDAFAISALGGHGHTLLQLCQGEVDRVRPYACMSLKVENGIRWGIRTPHWFLAVADDDPSLPHEDLGELYVKPDDRWEVNSVWHHHVEPARQLENVLRQFANGIGPTGPITYPTLEEGDNSANPLEMDGQPANEGDQHGHGKASG